MNSELPVKLRLSFSATLACLVGLVALASAAERGQGTKPNILILFTDDQRADTIASHGNPHIKTPHIDSLVRAGVSFRRNYVFGGNRPAVCIPSRAMLMTGKTWFAMDPLTLAGEKLMPELFGEHGYVTFGTGKWHNGQPSWLRAFQQGENVMLGGTANHEKVPLHTRGPDGKLIGPRTGDKYSSELFADAAVRFLEKHDGAKPFFLYTAFSAPHDPRQPPPGFPASYDSPPPLPPDFLPQFPFDHGSLRIRDENLAAWPRMEKVIRDQLAEYYAMIEHVDAQVGRILATLRRRGIGDNTIIVYAADNGLALGSHGLLGKQNLFEHSLRVPLILSGPGVPAGKSSEAFTYLFDLFPTLCELAAIPAPAGVFGQSLRPLWDGSKRQLRETVFHAFMETQRSVRDERWKLICYPKVGYTQLFDLQSDPHETRDLSEDPTHAGRIARLLADLRAWQARVGDPLAPNESSRLPPRIDLTGEPRTPDQWQPEWIVKKYFEPHR